MEQVPHQMPARNSSWHTAYEPLPWVFWVRITQLVLTILVLCLSAYVSSKYLAFVAFGWWAISWSIVYIPVVTWVIPRAPARYLPNVIVLVLEALSWIWWLSTFAMMAAWVSGGLTTVGILTSFAGGYKLARRNPYSSSSSSSYSSSSYDDLVDAYTDAAEDYTSDIMAAWGALKAATAFAAIVWVLFGVTLVATAIRFHRQRCEKKQQLYHAHGNPNHIGNGPAAGIESDKYAQTSVHPV